MAACRAGPSTKSTAGVSARWTFDEPAGSAEVIGDGSARRVGTVGEDVTLGGGDIRFPGWLSMVDGHGALSGAFVDDAQGRRRQVLIADSANDLSPLDRPFTVTLTLAVQGLASGTLPHPGVSPAGSGLDLEHPTYNIVQRGRTDSPGGLWKMELVGHGNDLGRIGCGFEDDAGIKAYVVSTRRVDDGAAHRARCSRGPSSISAMVDGETTSASAALGRIAPSGEFGSAVTVGGKPGSVDPSDFFAGTVDELQIERPATHRR